MTSQIKLSNLITQIQDTINNEFYGQEYWISTQITNVKKMESSRRCYLKLEEYDNGRKLAEIRAVFWSNSYDEIEKFEKNTGQVFQSGIEIVCKVKVRFHPIYGLNADVVGIDVAHTLGSLELERKQTLERLLKENPNSIWLVEGNYLTQNNRLALPNIISKVALITARNSDGQRDFKQEIIKNKYGYTIQIDEYLTTIQGNEAHVLILNQLFAIEKSNIDYDVIAIIRGGGSQTDFIPFDKFELANYVANCSTPMLTGIGHDRNQSIVDMMARELKTPTKVASFIVDQNFQFENRLIELKTRFFELIKSVLKEANDDLEYAKKIVKLSSPQAILNRGFAIIKSNDKIITNPSHIKIDSTIVTILGNKEISSTVTKKVKHEKENGL